jgi:hypothetical protein
VAKSISPPMWIMAPSPWCRTESLSSIIGTDSS